MIKLSIIFLTLSQSVALAAPEAPKGDKVKVADCQDGKSYYSTSNSHQGACARHGGVAAWADGSEVKHRAERKGEYR